MNGDYVGPPMRPPLGQAAALAEVSEYVAAAWSSYEQMREARDHALGRAEVAERELAAANTDNERLLTVASFVQYVALLDMASCLGIRRSLTLTELIAQAQRVLDDAGLER